MNIDTNKLKPSSNAQFGILLIVLFGLLLRCINLGHYAYWFDEKVTVSNAVGIAEGDIHKQEGTFTTADLYSNPNTTQASIQDDSGNGILHTYMVKGWIKLVGLQKGWVRLLSVFWGTLSILLTFWLGKLIANRRIALLASGIIAIHPLLIAHAQEVRAYSMALSLTLLGSIIIVTQLKAALTKRSIHWGVWLLYAILFPAAMMTHYLCVIIFMTHGLMVLISWNRKTIVPYTLAVIGGFLIFSLWYIYGGQEGFSYMQMRNERFAKMAAERPEMQSSIKNLVGGIFEMYGPMLGIFLKYLGFRVRELFIIIIGFSLIFIPIFWFGRKDKQPLLWHWHLLLLSFSGIGLSFFLAIWSGHTTSFLARYSIWSIPYLAILIAWSFDKVNSLKKSKIRIPYTALYLAWILVLGWGDYIVFMDYDKERQPSKFQEISTTIQQTVEPSDTIVYNYAKDAVMLNLFLPEDNRIPQRLVSKDTANQSRIYVISSKGQLKNQFYTNFENWHIEIQ